MSATPQRPHEVAPLALTARVLIPFVLVYGVYVIMHGDFGPGGGFQGGVILAAAYILYALVYGVPAAQRALPRRITDKTAAFGVMIYSGVGVVCLLKGGMFLDYNVLDPHHVQHGQELGMTLVEYGVGLTVSSVMITIFNEIAEE